MPPTARQAPAERDPLMVHSVEKAFRVLRAFDARNPTLSLTQLAAMVELDRSAAQRFTHTLIALGYLRKNPRTKRLSLTVQALDIANRFMRTDPLMEAARPYLRHLSQATQETVNLSVRDGTEIVFVARMMGRHVLNIDATIGSRHAAYCTAPGIAMLSRLPPGEAHAILEQSELRPYTSATTWTMEALMEKIALSARRGYATAFEEIYHGDLSAAAAITDGAGRPIGAVNVAALRSRLAPEEMERAYAPLLVDTALSISQSCIGLG
jgi:DNA-binding IclR family transcriptional regulator